MMTNTEAVESATVNFLHHGAAASSHRGSITWIPTLWEAQNETIENDDCSLLVYASHSVLNIAEPDRISLLDGTQEPVWHVKETLCTETLGKDDGPEHVITCLQSCFQCLSEICKKSIFTAAIVAGFADGTVTLWLRCKGNGSWNEIPIVQSHSGLSITCIDVIWIESQQCLLVMVGTSSGAKFYECDIQRRDDSTLQGGHSASESIFSVTACRSAPLLGDTAVCSSGFRLDSSIGQILALIGTAAPRHNKIHILHASAEKQEGSIQFHYSGSLMGHEDWITCMSWTPLKSNTSLLATGSQDTRIRLWKFSSTSDVSELELTEEPDLFPNQDDDDFSDDDEIIHEEEEDEGESRLDIRHIKGVTRVTLEALLMGHEEGVTSLCWYKQSQSVYNQENLLLSSSMDRSILLWTPGADGIWTPLARVGSAGGILGGSVGSTLLGYLSATIEPFRGAVLIGHAYGGAIHVWNLDGIDRLRQQPQIASEELASSLYWKAKPCITGHFSGVTDLCWESSAGHYLLTASADQTCRLWAPAKSCLDQEQIWLELARPQVHGYDLAAVTSLSSRQHPHFLVTGADEKELRGFDAPKHSLRTIEAVTGTQLLASDPTKRVERAYIPSLGLSNKATAAEGAEEDAPDEPSSTQMRLPLERDLGAVSLWPEVQKLFGHTTELYCVTSTLEAANTRDTSLESEPEILVASTCKARDADAASIRLWRALEGTCHQVLSGGHKSTVASLTFSPDGQLLASSGKDRRLCVWQRQADNQFKLAWAKDSAHKRIVWSVHFLPWGENNYILASGSRDGCVKIWSIGNPRGGLEVGTLCSFAPVHQVHGKPDAVTALSFGPRPIRDGVAVLALGLESGRLELWSIPVESSSSQSKPATIQIFAANLCHKATVTKIAWRPPSSGENDAMVLASCSLDHGCRIFAISF